MYPYDTFNSIHVWPAIQCIKPYFKVSMSDSLVMEVLHVDGASMKQNHYNGEYLLYLDRREQLVKV